MRAVQFQNIELLADQRDEGQEELAIEPAFIEPVRFGVGGGHDHHAAIEQLLEQPPQDHRIGDIGDLKFVEAEQRGLVRNRFGHRRDGIGMFAALTFRMDARVNIDHESVEVHARFLFERGQLEEQIHQHGFSASDIAPDIDSARRGFGTEEEAAAAGFVIRQGRCQLLQVIGGRLLCRIRLDLAGRNSRAVSLDQFVGHQLFRGRIAQ